MARIQDQQHIIPFHHQNQKQIMNNNQNQNHFYTKASGGRNNKMDIESHNYQSPSSSTPSTTSASTQFTEWNWNFTIVFFPFIILGFPIHLVIGHHDSQQHNRVAGKRSPRDNPKNEQMSIFDWLKTIFIPFNILRIFFSLISACLAGGLFAYASYTIWNLLYNLLYTGEINAAVLNSIIYLPRIIPICAPLAYFWCFGFNIKILLNSFDQVYDSFDKSFHLVWKYHGGGGGIGEEPIIPKIYWFKIICFYLVIILLHALQIYLEVQTTTTFSGHDFMYHLVSLGTWDSFAFEGMTSMILPIYCMFCWAISAELELLIGYLNLLVYYKSEPSFEIFNELKYLYKKIARQIMSVNKLFSIYISWLFFAIWTFAGWKGKDGAFKFLEYLTFVPNPIEQAEAEELGGENADPLGFLGSNVLSEIDQEKAAVLLRQALGFFFIALLQLCLLGYATFQAIHVNKAARCLHVILNDFVTYNMSREMTTELYQAFRLLKFFIHSTMERLEDPALLRIPILNYIPYFGTRLHTYNLRF